MNLNLEYVTSRGWVDESFLTCLMLQKSHTLAETAHLKNALDDAG